MKSLRMLSPERLWRARSGNTQIRGMRAPGTREASVTELGVPVLFLPFFRSSLQLPLGLFPALLNGQLQGIMVPCASHQKRQ